MLLAATMLMVAACGSDDDDLGGTSGSESISNVAQSKPAKLTPWYRFHCNSKAVRFRFRWFGFDSQQVYHIQSPQHFFQSTNAAIATTFHSGHQHDSGIRYLDGMRGWKGSVQISGAKVRSNCVKCNSCRWMVRKIIPGKLLGNCWVIAGNCCLKTKPMGSAGRTC